MSDFEIIGIFFLSLSALIVGTSWIAGITDKWE